MKSLYKKGCLGGLFLFGFFGASSAACVDPLMNFQAGVEKNTWQEFSSAGKILVKETGNLPFAALEGTLSCAWGTLALRGYMAQGSRDYSGVTNTGAALATTSRLQNTELSIIYSYQISPDFTPFASLATSRSKRDIQSVGPVLGYLEGYRMFPVQVGIAWSPKITDHRLRVRAFIGSNLQPRVTANLPGRDPLTLALGRSTSSGVSADWLLGKLGMGQVTLGTSWSRTNTEASSPGVVTRNGIAVGSALQPQNRLTQSQASVVWQVPF